MTQLPSTRQSLIIRLHEKSGEAWKEFVEIYEQAIYRFSRRRGLQDADAWDVTQDVLSAVERKLESWNEGSFKSTFRGWLFRVARNIAVDKVIQQTRRVGASGDSRVAQLLADVPDIAEQQSSVFWMEYRRTLMQWAVEQIKPDIKDSTWQSFLLTAIEGRKPEDVARELDVSIGSVYAAKFRIVNRIRKLISEFDDGDRCDETILNSISPQDN